MTAYDEVPYDCQPIPWTAPEQLATASLFHGGPCPPVRDGRFLEIGCGDGANLLALAFHRPDFRFVGVDASTVEIADARRSASRVGVGNTTLLAANIAEIGEELGTFDYIVAHGVMSWVSDEVREQILALCRDHLDRSGLLYLSYNTHPGWLVRGLVRDVIRPRAAPRRSLREMAGEARRRADMLRRELEDNDHPYARLLGDELGRVDRADESYLIHDYLEEHNRAFWFREFASLAAQFGFHYLAEAAFTDRDYRVPPAVGETAAELESERLEIEGLIDVLWYRQHRASLFCHDDEGAAHGPGGLPLDRMTVASGLRAGSDDVRLDPDVEVSFAGYFEPEVAIELSDPLPKAALLAVAPHWPRGLPWERMLNDTRAILAEAGFEAPDADDELDLQASLQGLHAAGQVEFRLREPPPRRPPSGLPTAARLTRWEAERRAMITTPTHQRLGLTPIDRLIIPQLDGRRERGAIIRTVAAALRAGEVPGWDEKRLTSSDGAAAITVEQCEQWVEQQLDRSVALLVAWGLSE